MAKQPETEASPLTTPEAVTRRELFAGAVAIAAVGAAVPTQAARRNHNAPLVLENARLRAEFDSTTGALLKLVDKANAWIIHKGRQSSALRIHLPLPDHRAHFLTEADSVHSTRPC